MSRLLAKQLVHGVASICVLPAVASYHVRARILGADAAFENSMHAFSLLPGLWGAYLRQAFLRSVIAECHPSARVSFGVLMSKVGARIGENAYVGPRCQLGFAIIERDVLLAAGVHIPSGAHIHGTDDPTRPIREQEGKITPVRIGAGTWVGSNAVIMADVGRNCVVGAGSVVTRPMPDNAIIAGVPAKVIRDRITPEPHVPAFTATGT